MIHSLYLCHIMPVCVIFVVPVFSGFNMIHSLYLCHTMPVCLFFPHVFQDSTRSIPCIYVIQCLSVYLFDVPVFSGFNMIHSLYLCHTMPVCLFICCPCIFWIQHDPFPVSMSYNSCLSIFGCPVFSGFNMIHSLYLCHTMPVCLFFPMYFRIQHDPFPVSMSYNACLSIYLLSLYFLDST